MMRLPIAKPLYRAGLIDFGGRGDSIGWTARDGLALHLVLIAHFGLINFFRFFSKKFE